MSIAHHYSIHEPACALCKEMRRMLNYSNFHLNKKIRSYSLKSPHYFNNLMCRKLLVHTEECNAYEEILCTKHRVEFISHCDLKMLKLFPNLFSSTVTMKRCNLEVKKLKKKMFSTCASSTVT